MVKTHLPKVFLFLSLLLIATLSACDNSTNYYTPNQRFYDLPVTSIDSIAIQRNEVISYLTVQLPTPCYQYHHRNVSIKRNNIDVSLYGTKLNRPCAQVVTPTHLEIGFEKPRPGEYQLRFNSYDTTSVDTTITIENRRARVY